MTFINTSEHNSNLAVKNIDTNDFSGCTHINISKKTKTAFNNSNYTSKGIKKASPSEAIRSQEDILKVKNYLLTHGRTPQLRLRNYALFTLGISIGVRTGDLLRLRISDVLNPDGTVMDEIRVFESKTRKSIYPFINQTAKDAITSYLDSLPGYSYNDTLFSRFGSSDETMTTKNVYLLMKKIQKELNLPYHLGAHSLRKTFAYWTIKLHPNDLSTMITLQEMLNHSSMNTTLHYAGQTKEKIRPVYYDLENVLQGKYVETQASENKLNKLYSLMEEIINSEE